MNVDLFEFKMKEAGFRTPQQRADALGLKLSAYYRRLSGECECTKKEIEIVAELLGWEVAKSIFFDSKVS